MSETILETIAAHTRRRVAAEQAELPLAALAHMCELRGPAQGHRFLEALRKPAMSFICEVKKASPSKGVIDPDFPYLEIARDYEKAGADGFWARIRSSRRSGVPSPFPCSARTLL